MAFEFEEELAAFTQVMRDKLTENQHKPTWKECYPSWLLSRLKEETEELDMEMMNVPKRPRDIARECADIACFAMMIADVYGGLKPEPERG